MDSAKALAILGAICTVGLLDTASRLIIGAACFITASLIVLLGL